MVSVPFCFVDQVDHCWSVLPALLRPVVVAVAGEGEPEGHGGRGEVLVGAAAPVRDHAVALRERGIRQRSAQRLLQAVELLAEQPRIGRVGRMPDTREFVMAGAPSIAAYQVEDVRIILRVLYGARQWPEQF